MESFSVLESASSSPIPSNQPLNENLHGADFPQPLSAVGMTIPASENPDGNTLGEVELVDPEFTPEIETCVSKISTIGHSSYSSQDPVSPLSPDRNGPSVPRFLAEVTQSSQLSAHSSVNLNHRAPLPNALTGLTIEAQAVKECIRDHKGPSQSDQIQVRPNPASSDKVTGNAKLAKGDFWKPHTLRLWFLSSFLVFQICIVSAISILEHVSTRDSGLTTITPQDSLYKTFLRSYLATAVALAVAMCWGAINLDVLRTEPYVLLSRAEGTQANALFDTNLTNLFRAFWITTKGLVAICFRPRGPRYTMAAFITTAAYIISLIILPPLQSSLMSAKLVETHSNGNFLRMLPYNDTNPLEIADPGAFLDKADALWNGNFLTKTLPVPVFSAFPRRLLPGKNSIPGKDQITILPVRPAFSSLHGNTTWEASTAAYLAKLQCSQAHVSELRFMDNYTASYLLENSKMPKGTRVNFADLQYPIAAAFNGFGRYGGCQAKIELPLALGMDPAGNQTDDWYYGGWTTPSQRLGSNDTSCGDYMFISSNRMSITYTTSTASLVDYEATYNTEPTFEALICQSNYLVANGISAKFTANSTFISAVVDPHVFESTAETIPETIFDYKLLESTVNMGGIPPHRSRSTHNSSGLPIHLQGRFTPESSRMYLEKSAIWSSWLDLQVLNNWSESWLQTLFVANIQQLARGWDSKSAQNVNLASSVIKQRLIINSGYAKATQGVLGLLIAFTVFVMLFDGMRRFNISFDPAPIASTVALITHSESTSIFLQAQGFCRFPSSAHQYLKLETSSSTTYLQTHGNEPHDPTPVIIKASKTKRHKTFISKRTYTHLAIFALTISLLCVVITLWVAAYYNSGLEQGLLYIKVDTVNSFAWTIVPVLAAILLKFSWSFVDGYFRLMQPYISLVKGSEKSYNSIGTSYQTTSIGWVTIKAALRKEYMLSLITAVSLLNEVLVVGFGALFSRQLVPISTSVPFVNNLAVRMKQLEYHSFSEITSLMNNIIGTITSTDSNTEYLDIGSATNLIEQGGLGAAAWTTQEYSFAPLKPQMTQKSSVAGLNWTMINMGVGARASCTTLLVPRGLIEKVAIPESLNDSVVYSYEMHKITGSENTNNTIVFGDSVIQIPSALTGADAMISDTASGGKFSMIRRFWAPLWPANISLNGNITYPEIQAPGPVRFNRNGIRNFMTLPEIGGSLGHFAVGFAQYSRSQYGNTRIWYSTRPPKLTFLVCKPSFQQILSKVIVNPSDGAVLTHEPLEKGNSSLGVTDLVARYKNNVTSTVSAKFGAAFLLRTLFFDEKDLGYGNLDFNCDTASLLSSLLFSKAELVNATNLIQASQKVFSVLFSQWAAVPNNVWVNTTEGQAKILEGYSVSNQTRILVSTPAMIIVVTILVILAGTLAMLPLWTRKWSGGLERMETKPEVLGEVIKLVCCSGKLLEMFRGQKFISTNELREFLRDSGKKFKIGKFIGEGGEVCFGIEVEDGVEWVDEKSGNETREEREVGEVRLEAQI